MKKIAKGIGLLVLAMLFVLVVAGAVRVLFFAEEEPAQVNGPVQTGETGASVLQQLAETEPTVDCDVETGTYYINNEIILFAGTGATEEQINGLLSGLGAQVDKSMADIAVYRLIYPEAMTYEELNALVEQLKADPLVEDAYLNELTEQGTDEITAGTDTGSGAEETARDPVCPDDPWNGASWDTGVPRDENWGVEAIDAPGAWAYRDQMQQVRVGLIDSQVDTGHEDLPDVHSTVFFTDMNSGETVANIRAIPADDHGTHVAGTIDADWNNDTGVSGVMGGKGDLYYSALYYLSNGKAQTNYGTAFSYVLELKTLIDQDVQVINISQNTSRLIGFAASRGNQNAIDYLTRQATLAEKALLRIITERQAAGKPDFVICVAAGNSNATEYYKDEKQPYGYRENPTLTEYFLMAFGWKGERGDSLALYNNFLSLMDEPEVKNRVIVVGAVNIDEQLSTKTETRYEYCYFSNVGDRVDIVAPGWDVWSSVPSGYDGLSGTSMATPHVTGVAGLVFACNPSLSGPQVKEILRSTVQGRYTYTGGYSGMVNARQAVEAALETRETPVEKVVGAQTVQGLDLCFVVDTTGSMGDDIDDAKANMETILQHLAEKTEDYRVAIVDYRDFPERSHASEDYAWKLQLDFSDKNEAITAAINDLDLGSGGDAEETVYTALIQAANLSWRDNAKKVIIILGDAPPLDPEPYTDYTYEDVLIALLGADIGIDFEASDERVTDSMETGGINVFSIGADASEEAADFFEQIADSTGGSYAGVEEASQVGDAIVESIEQIELNQTVTVEADFGDSLPNENVHLYNDDGYLFTVRTDAEGCLALPDVLPGQYRWRSEGAVAAGTLEISTQDRNAIVRTSRTYAFTPLLQNWQRHALLYVLAFGGYLLLCLAVPLMVRAGCRTYRGKKARQGMADAPMRGKSVPLQNTGTINPVQNPAQNAPPIPPAPAENSRKNHPDNSTPPTVSMESDGPVCPVCGTVNERDARFCIQCGRSLPAEGICPHCGTVCAPGTKFCGKCGEPLDTAQTTKTTGV